MSASPSPLWASVTASSSSSSSSTGTQQPDSISSLDLLPEPHWTSCWASSLDLLPEPHWTSSLSLTGPPAEPHWASCWASSLDLLPEPHWTSSLSLLTEPPHWASSLNLLPSPQLNSVVSLQTCLAAVCQLVCLEEEGGPSVSVCVCGGGGWRLVVGGWFAHRMFRKSENIFVRLSAGRWQDELLGSEAAERQGLRRAAPEGPQVPAVSLMTCRRWLHWLQTDAWLYLSLWIN